MNDHVDSLVARLSPYRETPGILAALLISHDGFVVAADADPGFAVDAVAAHVAGAIDLGRRLAAELSQGEAKYITLEFNELNIILAPFGDEIMLALIGTPDALTCEYRLNTAGA